MSKIELTASLADSGISTRTLKEVKKKKASTGQTIKVYTGNSLDGKYLQDQMNGHYKYELNYNSVVKDFRNYVWEREEKEGGQYRSKIAMLHT